MTLPHQSVLRSSRFVGLSNTTVSSCAILYKAHEHHRLQPKVSIQGNGGEKFRKRLWVDGVPEKSSHVLSKFLSA